MADDGRAADATIAMLSAMRIGIGALAWVSPSSTRKLFGMASADAADTAYPLRLFGIRDVVVGTTTLLATGDQRRTWVMFGLLCDAADGTAAAIGRRDGSLPPTSSALVAVPAAAVGLGLWLLRRG